MADSTEAQLQFDVECVECGAVDGRTRVGGLRCHDCEEQLHERYRTITDRVPVPNLTGRERAAVMTSLDEPSDEYRALVVSLNASGCEFPKVQAALMLLNTPAVAQKILEEKHGDQDD